MTYSLSSTTTQPHDILPGKSLGSTDHRFVERFSWCADAGSARLPINTNVPPVRGCRDTNHVTWYLQLMNLFGDQVDNVHRITR